MVKKATIRAVTDSVTLLADEMFPLYLLRGDAMHLIDAAVLARAPAICAQLETALAGRPLRQILLTHSHYDHVGAAQHLQQRYGCEIAASFRTKEVLENPKAIAFIDHLNQEYKRLAGDDSPSAFTMPASVRGLADGERIPLADGRWLEVVETPGHTRCSISFLQLPERVLFPGDAAGIVERDGRVKPLFLSNYRQYEASQRRLLGLDAEILAMPHNMPLRGAVRVKNLLKQSLAETERARDEILAALKESGDFAAIATNILAREYPNPTLLGPREAFMINLTAMVKAVHAEFVASRQ